MKEIKEINDNSLIEKIQNEFNDNLNYKFSLGIIKARIEENESFLEMAKLHMDNRAVLVVSSRIETLQEQKSFLERCLNNQKPKP